LVQSFPLRWDSADLTQVAKLLGDLEQRGRDLLAEADVRSKVRVEKSADGRFVGQLHELTVPLPNTQLGSAERQAIQQIFTELYEQRYGHLPQAMPLEFLSWRVIVSGPRPPLESHPPNVRSESSRSAIKGERQAYFGPKVGFLNTPVYDRYRMMPGMRTDGPAIVEERESTVIAPPDTHVTIDSHLNLIIQAKG
jgi:N-methylhydantoinase A/oxoprolinase/acetone carboxylase beta subunit